MLLSVSLPTVLDVRQMQLWVGAGEGGGGGQKEAFPSQQTLCCFLLLCVLAAWTLLTDNMIS